MAEPTQFSAGYSQIDAALKAQWGPFLALVHEMRSFQPMSEVKIAELRQDWMARLTKLNPGSDEQSLEEFAEGQVRSASDKATQFGVAFSERLTSQFVSVAVLSHALCEALINAILATGLVRKDSEELFAILERADICEKWRIGPKSFCPTYSFDTSSALYESLRKLTKHRNALVHHKIELHVGERRVLQGSDAGRLSLDDRVQWMWRFFSLPYDLTAAVEERVGTPLFSFLVQRRPILQAAAHSHSLR